MHDLRRQSGGPQGAGSRGLAAELDVYRMDRRALWHRWTRQGETESHKESGKSSRRDEIWTESPRVAGLRSYTYRCRAHLMRVNELVKGVRPEDGILRRKRSNSLIIDFNFNV
jgi:hypothetical protein